MSIKSRTIDNLGVEASVRYAKDKKIYESQFAEESQLVSKKTEVSVFKPYVPSEFDQLFESGKTIMWATFVPPPTYFNSAKPLFTYQLIPSFGGYEKREADLDKIASLEDTLNKQKKKKQSKQEQDDTEEGEKKRKTLLAFFECLQKLDKTLALINSRRNQYQRG